MNTRIIKNISATVLAMLALILFGTTNIKAAPGDLDLTFGNGGIVNTRASGSARLYFASALAIQSDGKVVAVGEGFDHDGDGWDFAVVRYNTDGSLDTSFGGTGIVITQVGQSNDGALSVAIQQDGKIVAAGYSCAGAGTFCSSDPWSFAVVRYNPNGSLDTSFNGTGKVRTLVGSSGGFGSSVVLQADGKIVVAGNSGDNSHYDFAVVRYNSDGSLDTSFGGTGIVITKVGTSYNNATSIAIQADGKIVAAGRSIIDDTHSSFAAVRYQTNGSLDTTFNGTGMVITPFGTGRSGASDLAIQRDGKILAAGYSDLYPNSDFAFVRYDTNGIPDTSFGDAGKVAVPVGDLSDFANSVAIQPDGKIVAAGKSFTGTDGEFATVRLNPNGSLDTTFNSTGKVITSTIGNSASAVAIQQDGKIVVAGGYDEEIFGFVLVRYQGGSTLRANGKIAFTSDRDGNPEIYVMNPDGTNQVRLTNNNIVDDHPTWSPDGRKIAFLSQRDSGEFAIFVMNPDGTGKTEIAPVNYLSGQFNWSMSWAPDGSRIVFSEVISNINILVIVNADGGGRRSLTPGRHPAWSPDGSEILFSTGGFFNNPLYTIRPDGTGLHGIGPWGFSPTWSPDGLRIAFDDNDTAVGYIYTANANGSNVQIFAGPCHPAAIPDGCGGPVLPAWSPDGRMIAFQYGQIYTKSLGGGESVQLTTVGSNSNPNWQPVGNATSDFDGDGRSDISVFRPSDRVWYLNQSANGFSATQFGLSTDKITPADYDGDGKTDIAVYRDGIWYWLNSSNGSFNAIQFGIADDIPVPADFTGDGRSELAIYRNGVWWMLDLSNNQVNAIQFGISSDKPVVADYDGDGRADQAVYRGNGDWYLNRSSEGYAAVNFGLSTDRPVVGDYDGDGRADQAVYRDGTWYLLQSTHGFAAFQFGIASDPPAPADYDGDGKTDLAVYRDGTWYLLQSTGGFAAQQFGLANDKPVPAAYLP